MKHALILADIEGIAGIYDLKEMNKCSEIYTREIEVCVSTLLSNGVDAITICDVHDKGDQINPRVKQMGNNCVVRLVSLMGGIPFDCKYDYAFLIGFHGMSGTLGILPHTLRFDFKEIAVDNPYNGMITPIGEVEIYSRWLGSLGIPVMLVTGDREAVYEANCFNPYRQTCCLKSYLQTMSFNITSLHNKLAHSIINSLKLDKNLCLSSDEGIVIADFHNPDIVDILLDRGYNKRGSKIQFNNCAELVSGLYPLVEILQQLNQETWTTNIAFLKELRDLAIPLKRQSLEQSEIGALLKKNLLFLDSASKVKIMDNIQKIIELHANHN